MQRTSFVALWLLIVGAAGSGAQTTLSEEAFLAGVDGVHPASRALAGELRAAEAERHRAALLSDPRLEITREELEDVEREWISSVAWTPPVDGRRRWAIVAAEAGVEVERGLLDRRISEQHQEVRRAYSAWAEGEYRVALMVEHSRRLESLAERMRHRAEAGEESILDAQRLVIASDGSRVGVSKARAAAAAARARAAAWLLDGRWELSAVRPTLPDLEEVPDNLDSGLRADLRAARSRVERSEALERLSRHVVRAPEVLLGWKSVEGAVIDLEGPVFGLTWEIPAFNRNRAERMAAQSAVAVASAQYEWRERWVEGDLDAALAVYLELRRSALAAADSLEILDDVARGATAAYEQGESSVTDLLDSLRAVLAARLTSLDLHVAALEAHRQLELAAGRSLISGDLP